MDTSSSLKKHRQRGKNKRIGFSHEIVTKEVAKSLLSASNTEEFCIKSHIKKLNDFRKPYVNKKGTCRSDENIDRQLLKKTLGDLSTNTQENSNQSNDSTEQSKTSVNSKKKRKRSKSKFDVTKEIPVGEFSEKNKGESTYESIKKEGTENKSNSDKLTSKRSIKKVKYQKLLEEKKIKVGIVLQQKALDYLLDWKNNKTNWKFNKLKQIWLLQNLYDSNKIDDKFWHIVIEYFGHSKGKVHQTILKDAIKIVENEVNITHANKDKLERARDIVQNLQE